MKELGEYLKETRINNGVSIEEAAEDNNLSLSELESIENGNIRAFKDVYKLKEYLKNYSKYLGLDPAEVADEFNDFLFEHTSKISLDDILEAKKKIEEKDNKKIISPYTKEYKNKINFKPIIYILLGMAILLSIIYGVYKIVNKEKDHIEVLIGKNKEVNYEFTY